MTLSLFDIKKLFTDPVFFAEKLLRLPFPLSDEQKRILRLFYDAEKMYRELLLVIGRKGTKTTMASIITLIEIGRMLEMEELFGKTPHEYYHLVPESNVYALNVATTRDLALNVTFDYIRGLAESSPFFDNNLLETRVDELEFYGNIVARCQGSSSRAALGYPCFVVLFDELAHFMDTRGNLSGERVYNALTPNIRPFTSSPPLNGWVAGKIVDISSPRGKSGIFWDLYVAYNQGKLPRMLMVQAPTWKINPLITRESLQDEYIRDPEFFMMEYGAEFADVVNALFTEKQIMSCVQPLPQVNPRHPRMIALDPGLTGNAYALALGYHVNNHIIIELLATWQGSREHPVKISDVEEFIEGLCAKYNVEQVVLDQYQSASTIQRLREKGYLIFETTFTGGYNMQIYSNLVELVNTQRITFPNYEPLLKELRFLQRITLANRFRVEAAPGYTDDLADAVANLAYVLSTKKEREGRLLV